jgi:hypothetical protein
MFNTVEKLSLEHTPYNVVTCFFAAKEMGNGKWETGKDYISV